MPATSRISWSTRQAGHWAADQYRSDRKNKLLGWAGLAVGALGIVVGVIIAVA